MLKKCIYLAVSFFLVQNLFADKEPLKQANSNYMALMLGSEGILPKKATPEQMYRYRDLNYRFQRIRIVLYLLASIPINIGKIFLFTGHH